MNPRYRYEDIDVLDFRVCYNGEWYNTRFVPGELIDSIMRSPAVETVQKEKLQKMVSTKGQLSFYDVLPFPALLLRNERLNTSDPRRKLRSRGIAVT